MSRDYYCSFKFKYLKVDLINASTLNCHAALPQPIDIKRLQEKPGDLFNIPVNVYEREQMLCNERNHSCEQNCWRAEDAGLPSPRLLQGGPKRTHSEVHTKPELLEIGFSKDCNYSCSYCCREYSQSWVNDLATRGNYQFTYYTDPRYQIQPHDLDTRRVVQKHAVQNEEINQILDEASLLANTAKRITITGGEPLLFKGLTQRILEFDSPTVEEFRIYSGLGLSFERFTSLVERLKPVYNKLRFLVSVENIEKYCEFNRYGSSWPLLLEKVRFLQEQGVNVEFRSTISNLTIFGFDEFCKFFAGEKISAVFAAQPTFMMISVMDDASKQHILANMHNIDPEVQEQIRNGITAEPSIENATSLREFLTQYVERRMDLSLDIYPKTFRDWINDTV